MANPYPGMNPYLEKAPDWPTFQAALVHNIWAQLSQNLPENYRVLVGKRTYMKDPEFDFRNETTVIENWEPAATKSNSPVPDKCILVIVSQAHELYLSIVRSNEISAVSTRIEVLSPANKAEGRGREEYMQQQRALLFGDVNLVEIDLLRGGRHTVAVPPRPIPVPWDYIVCSHRAHAASFEVWPVSLRTRLPRIAIPLGEGEPEVLVDLNLAIENVYNEGRFDRRVPYNEGPTPPLSPEDAAWSDQLLRAAGLRH